MRHPGEDWTRDAMRFVMDDIEHLRQRHGAAMRRLERITERDARRRRKHLERFDRAYTLLRQRLGMTPDAATHQHAGVTTRLYAGFVGALRSLMF